MQSSLLIIVKAWSLRGSSFVVALTFLVLVTLTLIHNIGYDVQALSPTPQFTPRARRQSGPHHAVVHVTASNHCTAISPFHCTHHQSTPSTFINIAIFILFWHSKHYTLHRIYLKIIFVTLKTQYRCFDDSQIYCSLKAISA